MWRCNRRRRKRCPTHLQPEERKHDQEGGESIGILHRRGCLLLPKKTVFFYLSSSRLFLGGGSLKRKKTGRVASRGEERFSSAEGDWRGKGRWRPTNVEKKRASNDILRCFRTEVGKENARSAGLRAERGGDGPFHYYSRGTLEGGH